MEGETALRYRATASDAYRAAVAAVQHCGWPIVSTEKGNVVFTPPRLLAPFELLAATLTLHVEEVPGGYADVVIARRATLDGNGQCAKVTGRVFHRLDQMLGKGEHLRGELVRADFASEAKRLLAVAAVFLTIVGAAVLFVLLFRR